MENAVTDYVALNESQVESEVDPFTATRYKQFAHWFAPNARRVLDVGCNTGRGGTVLKTLRPELEVVGLDLLQSRLDRLPKNVYGGVLCGSATAMPCDDECFDAVVAGEFIEHIPGHDASKFLQEAFRVLRMHGTLALTTPNPGDLKLRLRGGSNLGGSHVSQHHPEAMRLQLMMAGFNRVRIRGSGKVSWYLGTRVPYVNLYGSYMAVGCKV